MMLDLPADQQPVVWGLETSMAAEASPFPTPISREEKDSRVQFSWSIEEPPVHARYRMEWKFKNPVNGEAARGAQLSLSELMRSLDIVQEGDQNLVKETRSFSLPEDAEDARRVVAQLVATLERVAHVHNFAKGLGLAAPQIGIGRSAAVVRTTDGQSITLLNPRIINESPETDEQYEGCLSFFDVRGMVPRPLTIEVEHQDTDGSLRITAFDKGEARLVHHEIDHLYGRLYRSRMRDGVEPVPVSQYMGTGQQWNYGRQTGYAS